MFMSHRWAQSRRLDLTSHLRSIAGTIVEQEEAEKIFLANALGKNGVLNAWTMPQVIRQTVSRVCRMFCRISRPWRDGPHQNAPRSMATAGRHR